MVRSQVIQIGIVGLSLVLVGCTASGEVSVSSTTLPPLEKAASEPFQELLTQVETAPPQLIPELLPAPHLARGATNLPELPSVSIAAADAPLSVPVPPAPAIQTVPLPNPAQSVRVTPSRLTPNVVPAPQTSVAPQVRSPAPQPQVTQPRPAQSRAPQPQPIAAQRPAPTSVAATSLAESVQVTGIVHAGDTVSAIVQMPSQSSRYVRAGDYLANGSILVSRIEVTQNDEARVVLVQNGVQIVKTVGNF